MCGGIHYGEVEGLVSVERWSCSRGALCVVEQSWEDSRFIVDLLQVALHPIPSMPAGSARPMHSHATPTESLCHAHKITMARHA